MANELDELKAQLQAERSKNEKLSARLVTAEQTVLTHGPTTTPAIYGEFPDFDSWRAAGFARGYNQLVRQGSTWQFVAGGVGGVLGAWEGDRGYFIQPEELMNDHTTESTKSIRSVETDVKGKEPRQRDSNVQMAGSHVETIQESKYPDGLVVTVSIWPTFIAASTVRVACMALPVRSGA